MAPIPLPPAHLCRGGDASGRPLARVAQPLDVLFRVRGAHRTQPVHDEHVIEQEGKLNNRVGKLHVADAGVARLLGRRAKRPGSKGKCTADMELPGMASLPSPLHCATMPAAANAFSTVRRAFSPSAARRG